MRGTQKIKKVYKNKKSFLTALKRRSKNGAIFSAKGKIAREFFELAGIGAGLTLSFATIGAKIGSGFGPVGTKVGLLAGTCIGLYTTYFVLGWYVTASKNNDGSYTVMYEAAA